MVDYKFKLGDKIRCIKGGEPGFGVKGEEYVVDFLHPDNNGVYSGNVKGAVPDRFELIESKKYIVIDQDGYPQTFDNLEAAIESARFDQEADIYKLGRKLEKKTVVTWE